MRLTIVGCGDAFGSGGRFNTCFFLETAKGTLLVDFGASSLVALKARGLDPDRIDGIVLSHLHGDHFGALPFLLLDAQFLARRERPLLIAGPPGTRARLDQLLEVFFPRSTTNKWRFSWNVMEIEVGRPTDVLGHSVTTTEVLHYSGAPSTAIVLSDGEKRFAYSGDTEWVEALERIDRGVGRRHVRHGAEIDLLSRDCDVLLREKNPRAPRVGRATSIVKLHGGSRAASLHWINAAGRLYIPSPTPHHAHRAPVKRWSRAYHPPARSSK